MALSWRDLITTCCAVWIFGLYFSLSQGMPFFSITDFQSGFISLLLTGIIMFTASGTNIKNLGTHTQGYISLLTISGIVICCLAVFGLFVDSYIAFNLLTIAMLATWALITFYDLIFL